MDVKIREAKWKDYSTIYDCMTTTAWNDVPEEEKARTKMEVWKAFFRNIAEMLLARPGRKIFVAYNRENPMMGYVVTGNMGEGSSVIPVGMIFDIFVFEPYRKRGIARLLIKTAEEYCKRQGMWRIKLEVAENNPIAKELYGKVGFEPERTLMGKTLA